MIENHLPKKRKRVDRICVIESDHLLSDYISLILEDFGFKIDILEERQEILTYVSENIPRIYLIDVFLPQWNGLEIIQYLKDNEMLQGTRVIVLSAFGYQEVVQQAISQRSIRFYPEAF